MGNIEHKFYKKQNLYKRIVSFVLACILLIYSDVSKASDVNKIIGSDSLERRDAENQVNSLNKIEEKMNFRSLNVDSLDFTDNIKKVTVSKNINGKWVPDIQFYDGDRIKVEIKYEFEPNSIISGNPKIHYQIPNGVKVIKDESGTVFSNGKPVGNYTINTDGRIDINFNQEFVNSREGIEGDISFEGQVSKSEADSTGKVNFPGQSNTITIVVPADPITDSSDINVNKKGAVNRDKTKISYEVVAYSNNGTNETVNLTDRINKFNSANVDYSYDKGSIIVYKYDAGGIKKYIQPSEYKTQWSESSDVQAYGFNITGLGPLGPGESYKLTYDVNVKTEPEKEIYQVDNYVDANTGNKTKRSENVVKWSKDLKKSGTYDPKTGLISWEIKINPDGKDVSGWVFKDRIPGELSGEVLLLNDRTGEQEKININSNHIYYKFPDYTNDSNNLYKTDSYTIFYYTRPGQGETQVSNTGELSGDGDITDTVVVDIVNRPEELNKSTSTGELVSEHKFKNRWDVNLTLSEGILTEVKYEDKIHDAVNQNGVSIGIDSHYAIASELEDSFKAWLTLKVDDNQNYKYEGNGVAYNNQTLNKNEVSIKIKYYDRYGAEIQSTDSESKVKSFTIDIVPKNGFELQAKELSLGTYSTYTDLTNLKSKDVVYSKNEGIFGKLRKEVDNTFEKLPRIVKAVKTGEMYGADVYKSGLTRFEYDELKGKIKYRILLDTKAEDNEKELVIRDRLPEGTKFIKGSLKAGFYQNDIYTSDENYEGFQFDFDNPSVEINDIYGIEEIIIKIKNYKFSSNFPRIVITYEVDIKDDNYWKDLNNESKVYLNRAEFDNESSSTETTVKRDPKKIDKNGYQLDENDNPLLDSNGNIIQGRKPSNKIKYSIAINPKGENLDLNSKTLTLEDKIDGGETVNPTLDIDSVKLYRYDPAGEGNKGRPISDTSYRFKYDNKTKQIEMVIPDEEGFVLEYVYSIDTNFVGSIKLSNNVSLNGEYNSRTNTVLRDMTSSATVRKKTIKIYKVDEDNYKKILPGTEFKLEYFDKNLEKWASKFESIIVNSDGLIQWNLIGNNKDLEEDTLYRLTEVKALDGYRIPDKAKYFIWLGNHDNAYIGKNNAKALTANVDYKDIKTFSNGGGIEYITNKYTKLSVHKIWENESGDIILSPKDQEVIIKLYRQLKGQQRTLIDTFVLNDSNNWSKSWNDLDYSDQNGNKYYYTVEELAVNGYKTSYTNNEGIQTGDIYVVNMKENVINFELPETGGGGNGLNYLAGGTITAFSAMYICIVNWKLKKQKGRKYNEKF